MSFCLQAERAAVDAAAIQDRPRLSALFRAHEMAYRAAHPLSWEQDRVLRAIRRCRTAALGGRLYVCASCGHELPVYNSCKNRHCPQCQALDQARWIQARTARLLPVGHHHVVFTLPAELRPLARRHPRELYALLFQAAADTLTILAREVLGGTLGITAVLHTWTRELSFHPHVHCVVTAGALSLDGARWIERTDFLFPAARMKAVFRGRVLRGLGRLHERGLIVLPDEESLSGRSAWLRLLAALPRKDRWVVHAQAPFGRSTHVLQYLGRYTHRVAISDARLISVDQGGVSFRTRGDEHMTLEPLEFIRRFLLHVLPGRFHKIRHFGLYGSQAVQGRLERARALLGQGDIAGDEPLDDAAPAHDAPADWASLLTALSGEDPLLCPRCRAGRLCAQPLPPPARAPPRWA